MISIAVMLTFVDWMLHWSLLPAVTKMAEEPLRQDNELSKLKGSFQPSFPTVQATAGPVWLCSGSVPFCLIYLALPGGTLPFVSDETDDDSWLRMRDSWMIRMLRPKFDLMLLYLGLLVLILLSRPRLLLKCPCIWFSSLKHLVISVCSRILTLSRNSSYNATRWT